MTALMLDCRGGRSVQFTSLAFDDLMSRWVDSFDDDVALYCGH